MASPLRPLHPQKPPTKPQKRLDPKAGGSTSESAKAREAEKASAPSRAEAVAAMRTLGVDAGLPDAQLKAKMSEWGRHADDPRVAARLKAAEVIMADRAAKGKADPRATETLKALSPDGAAAEGGDARYSVVRSATKGVKDALRRIADGGGSGVVHNAVAPRSAMCPRWSIIP